MNFDIQILCLVANDGIMWNSPRPAEGGHGSGSAAGCVAAPAGAGSVAALHPLQETLLQAAMAESP